MPMQNDGEINLQVALLLLYTWDPENQELLDQRSSLSTSAAAKALGTTVYKLEKLIDTFRHKGVAGVKAIKLHPGINAKNLNITLPQVDTMCSIQELTRHATRTLGERAAIYNQRWAAQGCNLTAREVKKFYDGAGITL